MVPLKRFRARFGYSQAGLARLVRVDRSYISRLERGERLPGRALLVRFCRVFNCQVEELLT